MKKSDGTWFPEKIHKYCTANGIKLKGNGVVAGVSGGADSVALLLVLLYFREKYGVRPYVVHVNHMLRGEAADEDALFVEDICRKNDVPFTLIKEDVNKLAKREKLTVEEAGRKLRYEAFENARKTSGADYIAVAHNMEDQAETLLFRMFRGTGIEGLAGMMPKSGYIIRPLLSVKRSEIEEYVNACGMQFRTDATNFEREYSRNKIRLDILTEANKEINFASTEHLYELSKKAADAADFFRSELHKAWEKAVVNETDTGQKGHPCGNPSEKKGEIRGGNPERLQLLVTELKALHPYIANELVRLAISTVTGKKKDITAKHVSDVLRLADCQTGRSTDLPYGLIAERSYETIVIRQKNEKTCSRNTGQDRFFGQMLQISTREFVRSDEIPKNEYTKWFDYDKIGHIYEVRYRRDGDYLLLAKDGGFVKKPLNRFFIDRHVPAQERDKIPLLASGSHILWVVGYRATEACLIDEKTKTILEAKIAMEAL